MRKIFLFFISISLVVISNAQITKRNWLVGGNLAYSKSNSEGDDATNSKSRNIDVMSNVGYFFLDKLAAGIKLHTLFTKQKYPQIDGTTTSIIQNYIGIGPFIRYYFLETSNRINVFSDAGVFYTKTSNNGSGNIESVFKSLEYSLAAGTVIFLNTSVGIEFLLAYSDSRAYKIDSHGETFQFKIGFQIHLEKE